MKKKTTQHAWIIEWADSGEHYPRPFRRPMILSARLDGEKIRSVLTALWVNNPYLYYFEKVPFIRYQGKQHVTIDSAGPRLRILERPYLVAYRVKDLQITPQFNKRCEVITWTEPAHRIFDETTMRFVLTGPSQKRRYLNKWSQQGRCAYARSSVALGRLNPMQEKQIGGHDALIS